MSYQSLRVARIIQETPDARSFVLSVPPALAERFRYRPGQFLTFRVPHSEGAVNRCYSLSSAPESDAECKVTVKRVAGGRGSNWFHDALKEGAAIDVMPPAGRFVLSQNASAPLLFFAGGSGITPVMSLIKSALKTTSRRMRLFYANRDAASVIFRAEFDALAAANADRLQVIHHLDVGQGLTTAAEIEASLEGFETAEIYLCGPGPFMTLVETTLLSREVPSERIMIERFEASGNAAVPAAPSDDGETIPSEIVIHFEGKPHRVPYKKGQTILVAARAAGLTPNSACEEGFCASCAAKRIKGKIVLANNDIYTPEDLANGWILTCQGHAFGDDVEITYDVI
ncbi:MAG TPA: ferredoxin--NADP reductase [Candidatus Cybelea sp.]|nr:ferredoxin--NADP reductase [Candidatus Cybelea sp.]